MTWLDPSEAVKRAVRRRAGLERHRPGYWKDYHARNAAKRKPYLALKARERRLRQRNMTLPNRSGRQASLRRLKGIPLLLPARSCRCGPLAYR